MINTENAIGLSEAQADALLRGQIAPARECLDELARMSSDSKNQALSRAAEALSDNSKKILEINDKDVEEACNRGLTSPKVRRLTLNEARIEGVVNGIREVISLRDPVGSVIDSWIRPNGIKITRKRVPLGMIGIVY